MVFHTEIMRDHDTSPAKEEVSGAEGGGGSDWEIRNKRLILSHTVVSRCHWYIQRQVHGPGLTGVLADSKDMLMYERGGFNTLPV